MMVVLTDEGYTSFDIATALLKSNI